MLDPAVGAGLKPARGIGRAAKISCRSVFRDHESERETLHEKPHYA